MLYRVPWERGSIRVGDERTDDHDDEPTLIIPAAVTREWRRRLSERASQAPSVSPESRGDGSGVAA